MSNYQIQILKKINIKEISQINHLLKQLDPICLKITLTDLKKIINQKDIHFFIARNNQLKIVGMIILVNFQTVSGRHFRIEDFIVDKKERNRGLGQKLLKTAIKWAKKLKASHIDLTSRPERITANYLYQKFGFFKRKTNVYRYQFS